MFAATSGGFRARRITWPMCRSTSSWSLTYRSRKLSHSPRFGAAERHRPERRGGGFLQRALQPRLAALDQQLRRLEVRRQPRTTRGAAASLGTRSLHPYHQAMSCGFTNETVVHHGSAPPSSANQSANRPAMWGSTRQPCPGAPSGEGRCRRRSRSGRAPASPVERGPVVVAVGEVPLAVPAGAVAVLAQHRAPRGKAGIERAAAGDHAAGLMRVQAGQQRRARRTCSHWRRCSGAERHGALAQPPRLRRQARRRGAGDEPLREAQLVDDDHEDVRAFCPRWAGAGGGARSACGLAVGLDGGSEPPVGAGGGADREPRRQPATGDQAALEERATVYFPMLALRSMRSMRRLILGPVVAVGLSWPARSAAAHASHARAGAAAVRPGDARQLGPAGRRGDGVAAAGQPRRHAADTDQLPRGRRPAGSRAISVVGTQTERTPDACAAYSQGDGASFVPARAFAEGERVTVRAGCSAGARPPSCWTRSRSPTRTGSPPRRARSTRQPREVQGFHSRPDLQPAGGDGDRAVAGASPPATCSSPRMPGRDRPDR